MNHFVHSVSAHSIWPHDVKCQSNTLPILWQNIADGRDHIISAIWEMLYEILRMTQDSRHDAVSTAAPGDGIHVPR